MQIGQELLTASTWGQQPVSHGCAVMETQEVIAHNWPARFLNINKNQMKVTSQFCAIVNKLIGSQLLHSELSDWTFLQRTMSSGLVINRLIKAVKWNKSSERSIEKLTWILLFYVSEVMAWAAVEVWMMSLSDDGITGG